MAYVGVKPAAITSATEAEIAGNLTVDTNTLFVDSTNNHVAVGTTSPSTYTAFVSGSTSPGLVAAGTQAALILVDTDISGNDGTLGITKSGEETIINNLGNGSIKFFVNGSERAAFLADGGLTFNGDSGQVNALDDYEEGTWTPTVSTGYSSVPTYVAQQGTYTKIGRLVTCHCRLEISAGTQAGSAFSITGLPFTVRSTNPNGGGFPPYQNNFHSSADFYPFADSNSTSIFFHEENGTAVNANELDGTAWEIRMIIIYEQN